MSKNIIPSSSPYYTNRYSQYNRCKEILLEKQGGRCAYCGVYLTVDAAQKEHVIPRSKGGPGSISSGNIVASCYSCNMKKGTKTLDEFRKKLFGTSTDLFYFETLKQN